MLAFSLLWAESESTVRYTHIFSSTLLVPKNKSTLDLRLAVSGLNLRHMHVHAHICMHTHNHTPIGYSTLNPSYPLSLDLSLLLTGSCCPSQAHELHKPTSPVAELLFQGCSGLLYAGPLVLHLPDDRRSYLSGLTESNYKSRYNLV